MCSPPWFHHRPWEQVPTAVHTSHLLKDFHGFEPRAVFAAGTHRLGRELLPQQVLSVLTVRYKSCLSNLPTELDATEVFHRSRSNLAHLPFSVRFRPCDVHTRPEALRNFSIWRPVHCTRLYIRWSKNVQDHLDHLPAKKSIDPTCHSNMSAGPM